MIQVGEQAALGDATDEYLALVRAFPLVHIRDDAQYQKALAVMWPLVESSVRSDAQEAIEGLAAFFHVAPATFLDGEPL